LPLPNQIPEEPYDVAPILIAGEVPLNNSIPLVVIFPVFIYQPEGPPI